MEQKEVQELLKDRLKEKGLKVTRQRLLVLSVLEENSGRHMTAEDIYDVQRMVAHRTVILCADGQDFPALLLNGDV